MKLLLHLLALCLLPAVAGAQAPANDHFANRQAITAGTTTTANLTNATVQAGEPDTTVGRTVWYSYTPAADSIITLDTTGTASRYHFVTAYIGTDLTNLIYIDSGYSANAGVSPLVVSFKAKAGTTYQICAGYNGSGSGLGTGVFNLTLFSSPFTHVGALYSNVASADGNVANDRFANRMTVSGSSFTAINYMTDAGAEAGEPDTSVGKTAWYSYTAATDSIVSIDTTGTEMRYHFASVFMGTSINNLIRIDDDYSSNNSISPFTLSFRAKAGTTYQICVGTTQSSIAGNGALFQYTLTTTPFTYVGTLYGPVVPTGPTPVNDSFYAPQVLSGSSLTVIGSNLSATIEAGESGITNSLWYSWTSSSSKRVRVDLGQEYPGFGVYTGTTTQSAVLVPRLSTSAVGSYEFDAVAGVVYKLGVVSLGAGTAGQFQFSLTATSPPVNKGPVAKITSPKAGAKVSVKGFNIKGVLSDSDGIAAFEVVVNGKTVLSKPYPYTGSWNSGKVKKGKVTIQVRAKDKLGKWGSYHTVQVTAK